MGVKSILLVIGILLFVFGLFRFIKVRGNDKAMRLYGCTAYAGVVLAVITGVMLMENTLKEFSPVIKMIVLLAIFFIAGRFLLEPGFKRK